MRSRAICWNGSASSGIGMRYSGVHLRWVTVTTKIEVLQKRAALVVKQIVMAWECQLNRLWREGLHPRALANLEGDSTQ